MEKTSQGPLVWRAIAARRKSPLHTVPALCRRRRIKIVCYCTRVHRHAWESRCLCVYFYVRTEETARTTVGDDRHGGGGSGRAVVVTLMIEDNVRTKVSDAAARQLRSSWAHAHDEHTDTQLLHETRCESCTLTCIMYNPSSKIRGNAPYALYTNNSIRTYNVSQYNYVRDYKND